MVLVLAGCGAAVFNGGAATTAAVLTIASAFGLSVVAMAYTIGPVSGCHINPAITLGVWLSGRMKSVDALWYMAAQIAGAAVGSAILWAAVHGGHVAPGATTTGANALRPEIFFRHWSPRRSLRSCSCWWRSVRPMRSGGPAISPDWSSV